MNGRSQYETPLPGVPSEGSDLLDPFDAHIRPPFMEPPSWSAGPGSSRPPTHPDPNPANPTPVRVPTISTPPGMVRAYCDALTLADPSDVFGPPDPLDTADLIAVAEMPDGQSAPEPSPVEKTSVDHVHVAEELAAKHALAME